MAPDRLTRPKVGRRPETPHRVEGETIEHRRGEALVAQRRQRRHGTGDHGREHLDPAAVPKPDLARPARMPRRRRRHRFGQRGAKVHRRVHAVQIERHQSEVISRQRVRQVVGGRSPSFPGKLIAPECEHADGNPDIGRIRRLLTERAKQHDNESKQFQFIQITDPGQWADAGVHLPRVGQ